MSVFVDTNILLRSVQPSHPLHEAAVNSVASLIGADTPLLVAAMKVYDIDRILTFNKDDFRRYPDIEIITPT